MRLSEESKNYGFKVRVTNEDGGVRYRIVARVKRRFLGLFWIDVPGGWYFYEDRVAEDDIDTNIQSVLAEANQFVHAQLVAQRKSD